MSFTCNRYRQPDPISPAQNNNPSENNPHPDTPKGAPALPVYASIDELCAAVVSRLQELSGNSELYTQGVIPI
jgi:hypothetical protein